jgi:hypothetical protein
MKILKELKVIKYDYCGMSCPPYQHFHTPRDCVVIKELKEAALEWAKKEFNGMLLALHQIPVCIATDKEIAFDTTKLEYCSEQQRYCAQNISQWLYFFNIDRDELIR